ncbi:MAG: phosphopantothenoylcysteine decarboxylase [Planctomycetota bacterium]|nr:phosphopantothenoylcysteine decarboxylase [Planctomycetota bacterium]
MADSTRPIVVCVGGSIAAYKACDLVSTLIQAGHVVEVVMTEAAERFVRPLSFAALTQRAVFTQSTWFEGTGHGRGPADHLRATEEAALLIVAPCTANLLGSFAHGLAGDIVATTFLGATCPILIAPAMNHRMWASPRVQANVTTLRADGVEFSGPESGWLAEGEVGPGRMTEPDEIAEAARRLLERE